MSARILSIKDNAAYLARLRGQLPAMILSATAFSMPDGQANVMNAGFDDYLSEPFDPETFVSQIEPYLPPALRSTAPAEN